ncbi:MAG TPA: PAS domain S-box protein [Leptolyngbyaceae cyanobacterium M33_DOE_097]|nr:PAS domain S-box protein [Leptolyngbyaceae cyanobacterium M33_DOE_097]
MNSNTTDNISTEGQSAETGRKPTEAVLQESEADFRAMFNLTSVGMAQVDAYTRCFLQVNAAFCRMTGYTEAELLTLTVDDINHPSDRDLDRQHFTNLFQGTTTSSQSEKRYLRKDGSSIWVLATTNLIHDAAGQPLRVMAIVQDITERKQTEAKLRDSEERFHFITQAVNGLIFDWNLRTGETYRSERLYDIVGFRPEDVPSSANWWREQIHPDDLPRLESQATELLSSSKQIYDSEYRVRHQDGHWIDVWEQACLIRDEQGQVVRIVGCTVDITDRKQAEVALQESEAIARIRAEELETLMELVPVGIWLAHDPECQQIIANQAAYELMRATPSDFATDSPGDDNYPIKFKLQRDGQDIPAEELSLQRAGRTGREALEEAELVFEDGVVRHIYGRAVPLVNEAGNVRGVIGAYVDITENKKAEAALRNSERRFRHLVESNMFGVAFGDFSGGIHYVNDYFTNMVGYTREEIETGKVQWIDITPPEYLHLDEKAGVELRAKGVATPFEKEYIRKDGTRVPVLIGSTLLQNSDDPQAEIICFYVDLSERKRIEAALRQALYKLNFHVENTPMAVIEWDRNFQVTRWSKTAEQIFGWQSNEMLGRALTDFNLVFEPDSQQVSGVLDRLMLGEESCVFSYNRNYTKQGDVIHCEWYNSSLRDQSGQMFSVLSLVLDVTDRKQAEAALRQSEERYRYLVEAVPQLVWTADAEGYTTYVNQQMCEYIGLPSEQLIQLNWQTIIHPDDVEQADQRWMESVQTGIPYEAEYRLRRADGAYRWQLLRAMPFKDEQGQITQWFGISIDIHDKQELEEQRSQLLQQAQTAQAEAERANRIKDEFLAVLSHELRSPLNPILGWTRLLQSGKLNAVRQAEALATIERNAKLQTQLIEDLLDISRIMQGKLTLTAAPVSLTYVISAAVETVRLAAEAKQIQILLDLDPQVAPVSGDAARLQQVVWNLLTNAIKFTPNGGRVEVRLEQVESENPDGWKRENDQEQCNVDTSTSISPVSVCPYAQITVKDTGKGISADFLPHVFDYFRQADATTTRKFGGLGLGLAIVRQIVEMHGGTVKVESPGENQGATFTVQLPLNQQVVTPTSKTSPPEAQAREIPLRNLQILVVDDDDDTREFQTFLLQQEGAIVTAVRSGVEALSSLDRFIPDVIVSDVGMANMDGYMLMQQIRARPASKGGQIPAIALTAYARDFDQQRAFQAGFQAHITKPLEPNTLVEAIAQLFNRPKSLK